jgi:hypothetical protein
MGDKRQQRRVLLRSVAFLSLVVVAGCGGGNSGCALAPGPCPGDFPDENLPKAIVEPSHLIVAVGANATFVVRAPGLTTLTYQWYRSAPDGTLQQIPGATSAAYTLVAVQQADNGTTFKALVDGGNGSGRLVQFSSDGTLTVQ